MPENICPVWVGYLLSNPLRKLIQNPDTILSPFIKPGMMVADIGCAMGFFSIPMGQMVGHGGKVICLDVQEKMLARLEKKAKDKKLNQRMDYRLCQANRLELEENEVDFICAFAVVHEVPDPSLFFQQAASALKPGGKLLLCEPLGHVSRANFDEELSLAKTWGLGVIERPEIQKSHAAVLQQIQ